MPVTFSATEGQPASGLVIATFTDTDTALNNSDFSIAVNYGDGTAPTTAVAAQQTPTLYQVLGTHTFPEESGSTVPPFAFSVSVTVTDTVNTLTQMTTSQAQVLDAPLHQGNPLTGVTHAEFSGTGSAGAAAALSSFEAAIGGVNNGGNPAQPTGFRVINWDAVKLDGTDFGGGANTTVISQGNTVGIPLNRFQSRGVFFGAVYAVSGNGFTTVNPTTTGLFPPFSPNNTFAMFNDNGIDFKFVLPSNPGTGLVSAASRGFGAILINVELPDTTIQYFHNGTLLGTFTAPVGGKGQPVFLGELFNSPVVTNVLLTLGTDVIFKFDGTTFSSTTADNPAAGENLVVTDDWAYAEPQPVANSFPIVDGPPGTSAAVAIAKPRAGTAFTGVVASFSDDDPNANAKDYTATINWGDGHLTNGAVVANASGGFDVVGTNTYASAGLFPVSVDVADFGGGPGSGGSAPTIAVDNTIDVIAHIIATGADAGGGPEVKVYDAATGLLKFDFFAYDPGFRGGVRVAVADVTGDGVPDIITAPGPTGGPDIRVWDGVTGQLVQEFLAFDPAFTGGVNIAAADLNGDGFADIVAAPDAGGGPIVEVFNGKTDAVSAVYFAYDPSFVGGVRVAVGTIGGTPDIITAPGAGGGPDVRVFSSAGGLYNLVGNFLAFSPAFIGGLYVAAGDVNGDGNADVIVGAGAGGGPEVRVFSGATIASATPTVLSDYFAYAAGFAGGVRVAAITVGGMTDVVTGAGPGGGPHVRVFGGGNGQQLPNAVDSFFAYDPAFTGGVFVGGS
jgi:hypothetical protein